MSWVGSEGSPWQPQEVWAGLVAGPSTEGTGAPWWTETAEATRTGCMGGTR